MPFPWASPTCSLLGSSTSMPEGFCRCRLEPSSWHAILCYVNEVLRHWKMKSWQNWSNLLKSRRVTPLTIWSAKQFNDLQNVWHLFECSPQCLSHVSSSFLSTGTALVSLAQPLGVLHCRGLCNIIITPWFVLACALFNFAELGHSRPPGQHTPGNLSLRPLL